MSRGQILSDKVHCTVLNLIKAKINDSLWYLGDTIMFAKGRTEHKRKGTIYKFGFLLNVVNSIISKQHQYVVLSVELWVSCSIIITVVVMK